MQTTTQAAKPQSAGNKAMQVAAHLDQRATEAIRGKKGKDVADAFTFAANVIRADDATGEPFAAIDSFVSNFKL